MALNAAEREHAEDLHPYTNCPACGGASIRSFYEVPRVPVNSCLILDTLDEAVSFPQGEIDLTFCDGCGFIFNRAFKESETEYSHRYEETQGFSGTFNAFHERLADELIARHGLRGKEVIEIGCGKGEFLTLLCEKGGNRGLGFDPAYVAHRSRAMKSERTRFITDFYSEKYAAHEADFVCCKMTLEHIPMVARFISMVRRSAARRAETTVFFQIPEIELILKHGGFWDIYYEHCSYFSKQSLARLFRHCGFDVADVWIDYGDQYLMIEARGGDAQAAEASDEEREAIARLSEDVDGFSKDVGGSISAWKETLGRLSADGKKTVIWGSGSKAVAFLTTVGIGNELDYVVDINPHRKGKFMPGVRQRIMAPEFLSEYRPDMVVIMNPIYKEEIAASLGEMGCAPEIRTVLEPVRR